MALFGWGARLAAWPALWVAGFCLPSGAWELRRGASWLGLRPALYFRPRASVVVTTTMSGLPPARYRGVAFRRGIAPSSAGGLPEPPPACGCAGFRFHFRGLFITPPRAGSRPSVAAPAYAVSCGRGPNSPPLFSSGGPVAPSPRPPSLRSGPRGVAGATGERCPSLRSGLFCRLPPAAALPRRGLPSVGHNAGFSAAGYRWNWRKFNFKRQNLSYYPLSYDIRFCL